MRVRGSVRARLVPGGDFAGRRRAVSGTLQFDERFDGDAEIRDRLVVPESKTLKIGAVRLTGGPLEVNGVLALDGELRSEIQVLLNAPQTLAGFEGGGWTFSEASVGSSITGSRDFHAETPHTDLAISECLDYALTVRKPFIGLNGLSHVRLNLVGRSALLSGLSNAVVDATALTQQLEVNDSSLAALLMGDRAALKLRQVVLKSEKAFLFSPTELKNCDIVGIVAEKVPVVATDCRVGGLGLVVTAAPAGQVRFKRCCPGWIAGCSPSSGFRAGCSDRTPFRTGELDP